MTDIRSPRFVAAVRKVFEAPGEWGPAQGYYAEYIDRFIDSLEEALKAEPRLAEVVAVVRADGAFIEPGWMDEEQSGPADTVDDGIEAWAIFYEDPDHGHEVFSGEGAEAAARRRFEQARQTWNCTLFRQYAPMGWAAPDARLAADRDGESDDPSGPQYQLHLSSADDPRSDAEIRHAFFDYIDTTAPHETPVLTRMGDLRVMARILGHRQADDPSGPDDLGAAWAEVEAHIARTAQPFRPYVRALASGYDAGMELPEFRGGSFVRSEHDTPAAALRALAAVLREFP